MTEINVETSFDNLTNIEPPTYAFQLCAVLFVFILRSCFLPFHILFCLDRQWKNGDTLTIQTNLFRARDFTESEKERENILFFSAREKNALIVFMLINFLPLSE
jgi:hypothetical protein